MGWIYKFLDFCNHLSGMQAIEAYFIPSFFVNEEQYKNMFSNAKSPIDLKNYAILIQNTFKDNEQSVDFILTVPKQEE